MWCSWFLLEHNLGELSWLLIDTVGGHILIELKVGEALENLLQGGLTDRVIFELVLFLQLLDQLEEETDWLIVAFDAKTHVVSIVLDDLDIDEILTQALNDTEQGTFDEDIRCELY